MGSRGFCQALHPFLDLCRFKRSVIPRQRNSRDWVIADRPNNFDCTTP
jgi:hypothetical protein